MPLDGIVVYNLVSEFKNQLINAKIEKVYQPEKDELILSVRGRGKTEKLLLSASSSHPRIHFTSLSKSNPATPPMFCMLLRKHISGGKIIGVSQPEMERIIQLDIESYNELGDLTVKHLIVEIMGRHSNIIFTDSSYKIIDSIKHIDITISSIRQVMPGLVYKFPPSQGKHNPLTSSCDLIYDVLKTQPEGLKADKAILNSFMGISPLIGREICNRALNTTDIYIGQLQNTDLEKISFTMYELLENIKKDKFSPILIHDPNAQKVMDFSSICITQYDDTMVEHIDSINEALDSFYSLRDTQDRVRQKSADLLKLLNSNLERCKKKLDLQQQKLADASNRDQLKIYGDIIMANLYRIPEGTDHIDLENFYEENSPLIKISLDPDITPSKNAQKYYNKFTKDKNAAKMVNEQRQINLEEIEYLESILDALTRAENEQDLKEIREELISEKYLQRKIRKKGLKEPALSKPMHFISSDNFDIYVGKNNKQNDYLTLKLARSDDIWFHTKNIPGSHTIIKLENKKDVPDTTLMEAAMLASYYSKGKSSSSVPVDYTSVRNVKKPSGAKPGMVIYENYKTIYITPDENIIQKLQKNKNKPS